MCNDLTSSFSDEQTEINALSRSRFMEPNRTRPTVPEVPQNHISQKGLRMPLAELVPLAPVQHG